MKIGDLAKRADCSVDTIRFYEKEGLLPNPLRTSGNYRDYDDRHLESLLFIRHCRALDMSHEEIRQLLHWREQPSEPCREINTLIDQHILHVTDRIRRLQALEMQLKSLRDRCNSEREVEACGILQELAGQMGAPGSTENNHLAHTSVHEKTRPGKH